MEESPSSITRTSPPDLALQDLRRPGMSGLEGIVHLREKLPATRLFILSAFQDREKVFAALKARAHGYIIKTGGAAKVLRTLDDVAEGGVRLNP